MYQTCSILVDHIHCLSAQGCLNGSLCLSLKMEKNNFVILTLSALSVYTKSMSPIVVTFSHSITLLWHFIYFFSFLKIFNLILEYS